MDLLFLSLFFFFFFFFFATPTEQKPTITLNTTTLSRSGDTIQIQWSGITDPSELDWLGIYSPPNSSDQDFIGYLFLSSSATWQSGTGRISIPLTDLRSEYSFRIFRWTRAEIDPRKTDHDRNPLPGTKRMAAESIRVGFGAGRGPDQIRLALTGAEGEMRVMFTVKDGRERRVRYGERVGEMGHEAVARGGTYGRGDMCHAPANESVGWREPGFFHDAVMVGLKSGLKYYYQVGSDSDGWSSIHSFVTPDNDSGETIAFMFGDMGAATPYRTFIRTQDESISTVKWILRDIEALSANQTAMVSHIGDISYARGYAWIWDEFFRQIEPIATRVPYHVCIGNHEYDWPDQPWRPDWALPIYGKDSGGECGVPYSLRFNMPGGNSSDPTGIRNLYYSFNYGSVHFVYFSTETNFLRGSPQFDFLEKDLMSVNRTKTPFVVVQGHRPMYTTSNNQRDAPFTERLQSNLEPLFVENNVSLALWGHVHRYERFCPINNFTCGEGFPVHVVIGMAGQDWQPIWEPRPDHTDLPIFPQPSRSMYRGGEFGYTRLVANREKLTLSYVGNHDGEVHDEVVILASGKVISGGDKEGAAIVSNTDEEKAVTESVFPLFVKVGSLFVLGAFVGYVLGYISHSRKRSAPENTWTPVKSEET